MTEPDDTTPTGERGLGAQLRSVRDSGDKLEIVVDVANHTDRSLHYIAEVRAINYDPETRRLRLRLSDRGRRLLIEVAAIPPTFRTVEPQSEASLVLSLPRTIVRLAPQVEPSAEPRFEEHTIADAVEVEVEIGWSQTPYYPDVRERPEPLEAWEDGTARATLAIRGQGPAE
jgi:hypothetical protein